MEKDTFVEGQPHMGATDNAEFFTGLMPRIS